MPPSVVLLALFLTFGCTSEDETQRASPTQAASPSSSPAASAPAVQKWPESTVHALHVPRNGRLWAGTDQGLFRWDGETGWEHLTVKGNAFQTQKFNLVKHLTEGPEGTLFAAHHNLYRSLDGGDTWQSLDDRVDRPGGGHSDVSLLLSTDAAIFAGFLQGVLLRSTNRGGLWSRVLGADSTSARALTDAPDGTLYAGLSDRYGEDGTLHRSTDGGATWTRLPDPPIGFWSMVAAADGTLFGTGFEEGGVGLRAYRSDDAGKTWRPVSALERVPALARDREGHSVGLGMTGVFLRMGDSWTALSVPDGRYRAFAEAPNGTRYLGTDEGILHATDGGRWTPFRSRNPRDR